MSTTATSIVRVRDVMKKNFDLFDGTVTVKEALLGLRHPETGVILIKKRHEDDEYGIVIFADIAKKVLGLDRSAERVNLYELMSKPVLGVRAQMDIRYCARLMERFGITRAPVLEGEEIVGVVSYDDLVLHGLRLSLGAQ
jgi:CBS domain-containing protein